MPDALSLTVDAKHLAKQLGSDRSVVRWAARSGGAPGASGPVKSTRATGKSPRWSPAPAGRQVQASPQGRPRARPQASSASTSRRTTRMGTDTACLTSSSCDRSRIDNASANRRTPSARYAWHTMVMLDITTRRCEAASRVASNQPPVDLEHARHGRCATCRCRPRRYSSLPRTHQSRARLRIA